MILPCDCTSETQDKLYGKGKRVHNDMATKAQGQRETRCSVCQKVKVIKGRE